MLLLDESINVVHEDVQIGPLSMLQNLRKSMKSLLRTKQELTSEWAESVDFIIEDLSRLCNDSHLLKDSCSPHETYISREYIEDDIRRLEGEVVNLQARLKEEDAERNRLLHKYLDLKGNMRVFCRIKPSLMMDDKKMSPFISHDGKKRLIVTPTLHDIQVITSRKKKVFHFDKVFMPSSTQEDVFAEVGPLVGSVLDGVNVCVFAYGQTGAGKTYTFEGTEETPGVVHRTLQFLFHQSSLNMNKNYLITFSMLELYIGSLRDLLAPLSRQTAREQSHKSLSIQMNSKGWVEVGNLSEFVVKDASQAIELYGIGSRARSTACTNSNRVSSRSHCLIRITVASSEKSGENPVMSKLWLIDLGGSERLLKTNAKGKLLKEGKAINLSLTALGDVINALQNKQPHIPYRNSKLTQVLRDSLGKDAKTVMLVHVSQREEDVNETICSLNFAMRAKAIHLGEEVLQQEREQKEQEMEEIKKHLDQHEGNCEYLRDNIRELKFLRHKKKEMLIKKEVQEKEMAMKKEKQESGIFILRSCKGEREFESQGPPEDQTLIPPIDRHAKPNKSEWISSKRPNEISLNCRTPRFMATTASSRIKASCNAEAKLVGRGGRTAVKNLPPSLVTHNTLSIGSCGRDAKVSRLTGDLAAQQCQDDKGTRHDYGYVKNKSVSVHGGRKRVDNHVPDASIRVHDGRKHDCVYSRNGNRRIVHGDTKHHEDHVQSGCKRIHDGANYDEGSMVNERSNIRDDVNAFGEGCMRDGSRGDFHELSRPCVATKSNYATPFQKTTMVIKMACTCPLANNTNTRSNLSGHMPLDYLSASRSHTTKCRTHHGNHGQCQVNNMPVFT